MEFLKGLNDNNVYPYYADLKTPIMGMEYLDEIGNIPAFPSKPLGGIDNLLIDGDALALPKTDDTTMPPADNNIKSKMSCYPKMPNMNKPMPYMNRPMPNMNKPMPYMNKPMPYMNEPMPYMNEPMPYMNEPMPYMNEPVMPPVNNMNKKDDWDINNMNCQEILKCLKIINCLQNMNDLNDMKSPHNYND